MTITPGCYVDSHHGHYAMPMAIQVAVDHGFILDPFAAYVLAQYDEHYHEQDYPTSAVDELQMETEGWLNGVSMSFQNAPPIVPDGHWWGWNDGGFGLYPDEEED